MQQELTGQLEGTSVHLLRSGAVFFIAQLALLVVLHTIGCVLHNWLCYKWHCVVRCRLALTSTLPLTCRGTSTCCSSYQDLARVKHRRSYRWVGTGNSCSVRVGLGFRLGPSHARHRLVATCVNRFRPRLKAIQQVGAGTPQVGDC